MPADLENKKKSANSQTVPKSSPRGNMDEYEAVREIVTTNPGLLNRVLEKIRSQRSPKATAEKVAPKTASQDKK